MSFHLEILESRDSVKESTNVEVKTWFNQHGHTTYQWIVVLQIFPDFSFTRKSSTRHITAECECAVGLVSVTEGHCIVVAVGWLGLGLMG